MDPTAPEPAVPPLDPRASGPLDRTTALAYLQIGDRLLAAGEFDSAGGYYQRVIGHDDPATTAAAVLGVGNVLYRLDREDEALATWRRVTELGRTPSTYPAWRQIAAALVRDGELVRAADAYRAADRLAPPEDRAEIASRLGWLAKEAGDTGAARRYFARSRHSGGLPFPLTYLVIGLTAIVSITAMTPDAVVPSGVPLLDLLDLNKAALAGGEWWRLLTVTLVHGGLIHLFFNMYALYLVGPLVERIYGWRLFAAMYLLCAAAASVASYALGPPGASVGASGAIFGLFGVILAASRTHQPVLDRQGRAMVAQIGALIVLNLVIGFGAGGLGAPIDNFAHVGGLAAGLWLGFSLVPRQVRTMRDLWQRPALGATESAPATGGLAAIIRGLAIVALVLVILVGLGLGSERYRTGASGQLTGVPGRRAPNLVSSGPQRTGSGNAASPVAGEG